VYEGPSEEIYDKSTQGNVEKYIQWVTKVYPNFLDVLHSVLQQCEEKLRAPLMHTGTPSA